MTAGNSGPTRGHLAVLTRDSGEKRVYHSVCGLFRFHVLDGVIDPRVSPKTLFKPHQQQNRCHMSPHLFNVLHFLTAELDMWLIDVCPAHRDVSDISDLHVLGLL